ncbi:hypothetical protein McaMca56_000959 [Microsporum canis]
MPIDTATQSARNPKAVKMKYAPTTPSAGAAYVSRAGAVSWELSAATTRTARKGRSADWLPTLEKTPRVCGKPHESKFGQFCSMDSDCGIRKSTVAQNLLSEVAELIKEQFEVDKSESREPGAATGSQSGEGEVKVEDEHLRCRAGLCVFDSTLHGQEGFTGWPCRVDTNCRSRNCEAQTFADGKLTVKNCAPRRRMTTRSF